MANNHPILTHIPPGWRVIWNATRYPPGYRWICNNQPRFGGRFEKALIPEDIAEKEGR